MGRNTLGALEQSVLIVVLALGDGAYGVAIRNELSRRTQRTHSFGAVYTTLDRLSVKGLLTSRLGEATPERGGQPKRFFKLTDEGHETLARALQTQQALGLGLSEAIQPAGR